MIGVVLATLLLAQAAPGSELEPGLPDATPQVTPAPGEAAPKSVTPDTWDVRGTADLVVLDKIAARTTPVSIKVGQSATVAALTIGVRSCDVRPPDQAADATAFLDITDATPGAPQFHGWIIRSAPSVSGLEHPVYDVRLTDCR